jgi:serine protease Do
MRVSTCLSFAFAVAFGAGAILAQPAKTFKTRLSPVALDVAMQATVAGSGSVSAVLTGTKLAVTGTFEGLRSPVTIAQVHKGFPAERAGLRRNDVIVEYDGEPVTDMAKFRIRVADTPPGKQARVTVLRDGKRMPVTVTLAERTPEAVAAVAQRPATPASEVLAGLAVRDMTDEEMADAEVRGGVTVTEVKEGSAADDAGILPNDVIEEVGGKPASNVGEFGRLLRAIRVQKKPAVLLVNRNGSTQFIAVRLSD